MSQKHTVLYADDDTDDVLLLSEVFKHHSRNIDLITFSNGLEILSYLHACPIPPQRPALLF